jgi:defect in organelle trafficking protein DotC
MKFKWVIITTIVVNLLITAWPAIASDSESHPELLSYLLSLNSDMSANAQTEESDLGLRGKLLQSKGLSFGIQGGRYWASKAIKEYINKKGNILDKNFDFRLLVIQYKGFIIIPPVIEQLDGKAVYSATGRQIRTAESVFDIRSMPRFSTVVPTWRDYLKFEDVPPVVKFLNTLPSPKKRDEIALWQRSVKEGWLQGIEQSLRLATTQVALMVSDYQGMIRFHLLRNRNMIQDFEISEQFNEVVGGGSSMSINDVIINITVNPALQTNRHDWLPVPLLPSLAEIFPKGIYFHQDVLKREIGMK